MNEETTPPLPVQEPTGCACRWDSEGDRTVTCARHEGWLEVIAEWADRAREAEKKLKALAQPEQEPVAWDKPNASFDDWWDSDRRRDNANPFTADSFAFWAFEGWQAALAQRTWVGLTEQDMPSGEDPMFDHHYFIAGMVYANKVLKEKNNAA